MRLIRIYGLALAAAALGGCGDGDSAGQAGRAPVIATTPVIADLASQVAGDRIEVKRMLAPNADPHDYEPRPSDAASVAEAELVLRSGGDLDEWMDELAESSGSEAEVVNLIDSVAVLDRGAGDETDPHWWHSPANAIAAVRAIRDALIAADPEGRRQYTRNAGAYTGRLAALDRKIRDCMAAIPAPQRKLVTTHDALAYFAARYRIEVIGAVVPSLSTEGQPSAGDTAQLIGQIEREGVDVVFSESSVDSKVEATIAREAGARLGDPLWADTLGPPGSGGETYAGALAANADALSRGFTDGALSCELDA